ncbi:MAG: DUF433 domain-containing protein [Verrucomicrobiota bacterium]
MDSSTPLARIVLDPAVGQGRPIIRGTRLTVETVVSCLSAGDPIEEVLEAHPRLTREDVLACLAYARHLGRVHSTLEVPSPVSRPAGDVVDLLRPAHQRQAAIDSLREN